MNGVPATKQTWSAIGNFASEARFYFWVLMCACCWSGPFALWYAMTQMGNVNDGQLGFTALPIILFIFAALPLGVVATLVALIVGIKARSSVASLLAILSFSACGFAIWYGYCMSTAPAR